MNTDSFLQTIYNNAPDLMQQIETFISEGEHLNHITSYCESPLRVASNNGRYDVVLRLLAAGADEYQLEWTDTVMALVRGPLTDLENRLKETDCSEIEVKDWWERTPLLIAIQLGDIEKLALLLEHGADSNAVGRCRKTPLMFAVDKDSPAMLEFLLDHDFGLEDRDEFGVTALEYAVENGKAASVRLLLQRGACIRGNNEYGFPLIYEASTVEVAKILAEHGEDFSRLNEELHAKLIGMQCGRAPVISREDYLAARCRCFGTDNPEETSKPFWLAMVRCGGSAWHATNLFGDSPFDLEQPVWSYQRYGRSTTLMPDGRIIEIGGEHEDSYDPDFCIYNDVTVFDSKGEIRIFSYPKELFPPTDFHTATLVGDFIYIIGCLGYPDQQRVGQTPVYRLDTRTYQIERIETGGEMPGWISMHKARLSSDGRGIRISAGKRIVPAGEETDYVASDAVHELCLETLAWRAVCQ